MTQDLRNHALEELHRRLRIPCEYQLPDDGGGSITVHAAVSDNPLDIAALKRTAEAADDGKLLPWLWAPNGYALLTPAQARCLAASVAAFEAVGWGYLGTLLRQIDAGEITTPAQIADAPWPV
jgi:hypothetical protein